MCWVVRLCIEYTSIQVAMCRGVFDFYLNAYHMDFISFTD